MFVKAYRKGKSAVNKYVAVYVLKNYRKAPNGMPVPTHLGLSINAKLGKACKRSRVKRIIREAYRQNLPYIKDGYIIVIAARTAVFDKRVKSTVLSQKLLETLRTLGVVKE